jgi:hypothetical protein
MQYLRNAFQLLQKVGPYFLLELLMPGGTLLALLLFLYQRNQGSAGRNGALGTAIVIAWTIGKARAVLDMLPFDGASRPIDRFSERDGLEPLAMAPGL